jgi:hypothetical protein
MSAEQVATIEGQPVYSMELPLDKRIMAIRERTGQKTICPLCGTGWTDQVPTKAKTLLSNNKFFPNSLLHQGCIEHAGGMQAAAEALTDLYNEFRAVREKFGPSGFGWMP